MWQKLLDITCEIRLQKDCFHLGHPLLLSFAHSEETSCSMERLMRQKTEGGLWPTASKNLSPHSVQEPMRI